MHSQQMFNECIARTGSTNGCGSMTDAFSSTDSGRSIISSSRVKREKPDPSTQPEGALRERDKGSTFLASVVVVEEEPTTKSESSRPQYVSKIEGCVN